VRDFLIRTYPDEHKELSKRVFKSPEYCAACHKQFIDQEVNRVGWVQLQNQYDNWKASHWFVEGDARRRWSAASATCRWSTRRDPARATTPTTTAPRRRQAPQPPVPGRQQHGPRDAEAARLGGAGGADEGMAGQGDFEIPEIEPQVAGRAGGLDRPRGARDGGGRRQPAGPRPPHRQQGRARLSRPVRSIIIQSWVELRVVDEPAGGKSSPPARATSGTSSSPARFLFKAEPVDQHGNLIDRHNLWEMVGVRFRRSLFPGYSDTVEYNVDCPAVSTHRCGRRDHRRATAAPGSSRCRGPSGRPGTRVTAILLYRKVDQFLMNFFLGENALTAPVIEIARATAVFEVSPAPAGSSGAAGAVKIVAV
jgi:hypothetical protein